MSPAEPAKTDSVPLFPLHTVLFPGGSLPLRIFEPRYLDMISSCLRTSCGFGVCLIRSGHETGAPAEIHDIGTLARITDWHQRHDGLLGITVTGERRFNMTAHETQDNGLAVADIEFLPRDEGRDLPTDFLPLSQLVERLIEQVGHHYADMPKHYDDATWISYRLCELLPIDNAERQRLLEIDDAVQRLQRLNLIVSELSG